MTVALAGLVTTLMIAITGFVGALANASEARTRAQLAADAAALGAIYASVPGASGTQEDAARRYADANGAELVECMCEDGSSAVQVKVSFDGVIARARATLNPNMLALRRLGLDGRGLHPQLAAAVQAIVRASRGTVFLRSGWRSLAEQTVLWQDALSRYGDPEVADNWVARPGTSMHEAGLAVDLEGDIALAWSLTQKLGLPLHRPLDHEPWHFELLGSRS